MLFVSLNALVSVGGIQTIDTALQEFGYAGASLGNAPLDDGRPVHESLSCPCDLAYGSPDLTTCI